MWRNVCVPIGRHGLELHTFVKASSDAYCAVVYLKSDYNGEVSVTKVAAKSKVAPLKSMSICRLVIEPCSRITTVNLSSQSVGLQC